MNDQKVRPVTRLVLRKVSNWMAASILPIKVKHGLYLSVRQRQIKGLECRFATLPPLLMSRYSGIAIKMLNLFRRYVNNHKSQANESK